jgi:hypothetical protein
MKNFDNIIKNIANAVKGGAQEKVKMTPHMGNLDKNHIIEINRKYGLDENGNKIEQD